MNARTSADDASRRAAFQELFEAHHERIVRYVYSQLGDDLTAEDVAGEVFRVAWQKLDPDAPFGVAWLMRTAMHKVRDLQRKNARGEVAATTLSMRAPDPDHEDGELDRLVVIDAMSRLPAKDRQILQLTYWQDLSAGEIAEVLRMRQGAVWTRLHRARARLKELLEEDDQGGVRDERRRVRKTASRR